MNDSVDGGKGAAAIPLDVLIIEDSEDDTLLLVRELRKGGFAPSYEQVYTAAAMRKALAGRSWDLVIADHNMPQFDAIAALRILQASGRDTPFIIVSASIGEEVAVAAMKAGAHDYLLKARLARLVPAVERELRDAEDRRARRRAEALIRYQAEHDALTGLFNRRAFEQHLQQALANYRQRGTPCALCYMDLDQFKVVNDTCGHMAGDELLKQLVVEIRQHTRGSDILARLGGDEFGMILKDCSLEAATGVAQHLLDALKEFRFSWLEHSFEVGMSIGIVSADGVGGDDTTLLSAADMACYMAKELGRNRWHVYQPDDAAVARHRGEMGWVANLTEALEQQRLRLYCEPIVPLQSEAVRDYEVLLRIAAPDGSLIYPGQFIPAAERYGLMPNIDRWVVDHVLQWCRGSGLAGADDGTPRPHFSINLSGTSLGDDQFLGFVQERFAAHGVWPGRITFEITETAAIVNLTKAIDFIDALRTTGCRFALDDFGSGLSSFRYLKNLPVDFIKIDGSFVKDILHDPMDHALVEAIHHIGHVIGLRTIAEFVENGQILDKVRGLGIDYAQGYVFGRARPLDG